MIFEHCIRFSNGLSSQNFNIFLLTFVCLKGTAAERGRDRDLPSAASFSTYPQPSRLAQAKAEIPSLVCHMRGRGLSAGAVVTTLPHCVIRKLAGSGTAALRAGAPGEDTATMLVPILILLEGWLYVFVI